MKNNTHGYALVIMLIVALIVALLFAMSFKSLYSLKPASGNPETGTQTYEEIINEAVSNANNFNPDAYSYLDK